MIRDNWLFLVIIGVGILLLHYANPEVSQADRNQASYCQDEAVRNHLGVVYDPETHIYHYSDNKLEQLAFYSFMANCLPEKYPTKRQMIQNLEDLKDDLGIKD